MFFEVYFDWKVVRDMLVFIFVVLLVVVVIEDDVIEVGVLFMKFRGV